MWQGSQTLPSWGKTAWWLLPGFAREYAGTVQSSLGAREDRKWSWKSDFKCRQGFFFVLLERVGKGKFHSSSWALPAHLLAGEVVYHEVGSAHVEEEKRHPW